MLEIPLVLRLRFGDSKLPIRVRLFWELEKMLKYNPLRNNFVWGQNDLELRSLWKYILQKLKGLS